MLGTFAFWFVWSIGLVVTTGVSLACIKIAITQKFRDFFVAILRFGRRQNANARAGMPPPKFTDLFTDPDIGPYLAFGSKLPTRPSQRDRTAVTDVAKTEEDTQTLNKIVMGTLQPPPSPTTQTDVKEEKTLQTLHRRKRTPKFDRVYMASTKSDMFIDITDRFNAGRPSHVSDLSQSSSDTIVYLIHGDNVFTCTYTDFFPSTTDTSEPTYVPHTKADEFMKRIKACH